jgi:tRNA1(Val) A37 N6-methylase TrmN6
MASLFGKNRLRELAQKINTDDVRDEIAIVQTWCDDYHKGSLKADKETSREQAYNQAFFIKILGYKEKPSVPFSFEPKATTDTGQLPDAVISYTDKSNGIQNISAVVELKGSGVDLDRPQRREGNFSPVQQGFKYKTQYRNCPFVIVSNFWEFRLYRDNLLDYELWTLDDLVNPAEDYLLFKTWYALLRHENFTTSKGASKTENLLSDIRIEQEEIGKKFYKVYKEARLDLLRDIYNRNAHIKADIDVGIEKAQKIIDRIVFACFAEDRGLLPDNTLHRVVKAADSSTFGGSLWSTFKSFFEAINVGSVKLEIPDGYNGGLFAHDETLNNLQIDDDVLRAVATLSSYNFEEDLSVTILGHIFEQSISDLEEIKTKVNESQNLEFLTLGRRKKEGIFYTPDYIVRYIVENSLGTYLREYEEKFKQEFKLKGDITDKTYDKREKQAYRKYQDFLHSVKVVDPACGSGAFLVYVFDYLIAENKRVGDILGDLFSSEQYVKSILQNNIYGVDLNEESVEITKLSLWLKSAEKGKKLTALDENIKCGNSLIDDPSVADNKAFNWHEEFSNIFKDGGFDVVVMNPPYVDSESMAKSIPEQRNFLAKNYETTKGNWDLYIPFIEKATDLLKPGGFTSFITPDKWIAKPFGHTARKKLMPMLTEAVIAGRDVFHDAKVDSIVTTLRKQSSNTLLVRKINTDHNFEDVNSIDKSLITEPYTIDHLFSEDLNLITKIEQRTKKLSEIAECENACATSDAYKLKDLLYEAKQISKSQLKVINTGTIDKYIPRWGVTPMTYLGDKYLHPVIDVHRFEKEFGNSYYKKSLKPKLIIKSLTLLDACEDFDAQTVPGKSTLVIANENLDYLRFLLVFLNSKLPIFYIKRKYSSASYNQGINFTKDMINNLPAPELSENLINEFVVNSHSLLDFSKSLREKSLHFQSLIISEFELEKWPTKLNKWWSIDSKDFVKALNPKMSLQQKDELLKLFEKYRIECQVVDSKIKNIEAQINSKIYKLYNLNDEDIKVIEGSTT